MKAGTSHLNFCPDKTVKTGLEMGQSIGMKARTTVLIYCPARIAKRELGTAWSTDMKVE